MSDTDILKQRQLAIHALTLDVTLGGLLAELVPLISPVTLYPADWRVSNATHRIPAWVEA